MPRAPHSWRDTSGRGSAEAGEAGPLGVTPTTQKTQNVKSTGQKEKIGAPSYIKINDSCPSVDTVKQMKRQTTYRRKMQPVDQSRTRSSYRRRFQSQEQRGKGGQPCGKLRHTGEEVTLPLSPRRCPLALGDQEMQATPALGRMGHTQPREDLGNCWGPVGCQVAEGGPVTQHTQPHAPVCAPTRVPECSCEPQAGNPHALQQ